MKTLEPCSASQSPANPHRRREEFLMFGAPAIEPEDAEAVAAVVRSGWLGTGPKAAQFEKEFWAYKSHWGVPVAVNSCTAALHLSMAAAGLEPGSEVITSALTFCATVNAIIHAGLKPVLADVDSASMNLAPEEVERRITPRTRAIVPVHFAGRPCRMEALCQIARRHGLRIIEDCAHAIETRYHGRPAGTFGDFGCFSFYVTKNITTGEGGMILARNDAEAARCKVLALHGMSKDAWKRFDDEGYKHYQVVGSGYKYNLTDMQAALGLLQLRRIERYYARRQEIWTRYQAALAELPVELPAPPEPDTQHALHLYTLLIDERVCGLTRDQFLIAMTARNLGVGVHYLSIPEHPHYQQTFGWKPEDYPNAMRIGRSTVSIPLSARLTDVDVEDVIAGVTDIVRRGP